MLGVCISLQDQQFSFLNRMISSSYERDMIKTRNTKYKEFCRNPKRVLENSQMFGGKERGLKGGRERNFSTNQGLPHQLPVGGAWPSRHQRAPLAVRLTASLTGWLMWPLGTSHLSRALFGFSTISWASELQFRICFRLRIVTPSRTNMTTTTGL